MSRPWPVERDGSRGEPVQTVQYLLRSWGQSVVVDGDFGPKTDHAARAFQSAKKITADGVVGEQTWPRLIVAVHRGSTGDAVRAVQDQARFRAGEPSQALAIDGVFGPRTEAWVRAFQQAVGITADGAVGPLTWKPLVNEEFNI